MISFDCGSSLASSTDLYWTCPSSHPVPTWGWKKKTHLPLLRRQMDRLE